MRSGIDDDLLTIPPGEPAASTEPGENTLSKGENIVDSTRRMGGMTALVKNIAMLSTIGSVTKRITRRGRCNMNRKRGGSS